MSLAKANQKLYFAALVRRILAFELERGHYPSHVLLAALGEAVRFHLREAYGWFLLELAESETPPASPPGSVADTIVLCHLSEPLRGELVELANLEERDGWLADLLHSAAPEDAARPADGDIPLRTRGPWEPARLDAWYEGLADIMERMSDSLEEW